MSTDLNIRALLAVTSLGFASTPAMANSSAEVGRVFNTHLAALAQAAQGTPQAEKLSALAGTSSEVFSASATPRAAKPGFTATIAPFPTRKGMAVVTNHGPKPPQPV